nr:MAG TPA: hypothetical protein [Caudoviricetes sp.]
MIKVKKSTLKALLTGAFILQAGHGSFQSFIQIEVLRQPENILATNFYSSLLVKIKWMGGVKFESFQESKATYDDSIRNGKYYGSIAAESISAHIRKCNFAG